MKLRALIKKSYSPNPERDWYGKLKKPSWTPKPKTIGKIWALLYPIIILTYAYVIYRAILGEISWSFTLPFFLNLAANLAFTPILFGLKNLKLALLDIAIVWITIIWTIIISASVFPIIALLQIPYLIWVTIASTLQLYITTHN